MDVGTFAQRRWRILLAAVVLAGLSLGTHQQDLRMVSGTVLAESPTADVARCAFLEAGPASQGLTGWVVRLRADEDDGWHGFRLASSSVGQTSPLAVTFYRSLGTCEDGGEPLVYGRQPGDAWSRSSAVEGWVPRGARWAVIGRWSPHVYVPYTGIPQVSPGAGVQSSFTLTISDPPPWWDGS